MTLFMVLERFRPGRADEVYRRFRERGRMLPPGVEYVDSWVDDSYDRCFQLVQADDAGLVREWTDRWADLVEFEVVPVRTSAEAAAAMAQRAPPDGPTG